MFVVCVLCVLLYNAKFAIIPGFIGAIEYKVGLEANSIIFVLERISQ